MTKLTPQWLPRNGALPMLGNLKMAGYGIYLDASNAKLFSWNATKAWFEFNDVIGREVDAQGAGPFTFFHFMDLDTASNFKIGLDDAPNLFFEIDTAMYWYKPGQSACLGFVTDYNQIEIHGNLRMFDSTTPARAARISLPEGRKIYFNDDGGDAWMQYNAGGWLEINGPDEIRLHAADIGLNAGNSVWIASGYPLIFNGMAGDAYIYYNSANPSIDILSDGLLAIEAMGDAVTILGHTNANIFTVGTTDSGLARLQLDITTGELELLGGSARAIAVAAGGKFLPDHSDDTMYMAFESGLFTLSGGGNDFRMLGGLYLDSTLFLAGSKLYFDWNGSFPATQSKYLWWNASKFELNGPIHIGGDVNLLGNKLVGSTGLSGNLVLEANDTMGLFDVGEVRLRCGESGKVSVIADVTTIMEFFKANCQFYKPLYMNNNLITGLPSPTNAADAATKAYVDQLQQGLDWQESVRDKDLTAPPGGEAIGWRFIVGASATGAWSGHDFEIAEVTAISPTTWAFTTPDEGTSCFVEDEDMAYIYNAPWDSTNHWVKLSSIHNHNDLSNIQGGTATERYHLTSAQHTGLTGAGNADALHSHAHSATTGQTTDDHHARDHKDTHKSGGADAFVAADILEATVKRLQTTTGPTTLLMGAVADGEFLKRSGTGIIGATPSVGTGTSFPGSPTDGLLFYRTDLDCLFKYDSGRGKWLSVDSCSVTLAKTAAGAIATQYLGIADMVTSSTVGFILPANATIVCASYRTTRAAAGAGTRPLSIRVNDVAQKTFTLPDAAGNAFGVDVALNIDVTGGATPDQIQSRLDGVGGGRADSDIIVHLTIKRRG